MNSRTGWTSTRTPRRAGPACARTSARWTAASAGSSATTVGALGPDVAFDDDGDYFAIDRDFAGDVNYHVQCSKKDTLGQPEPKPKFEPEIPWPSEVIAVAPQLASPTVAEGEEL